MSTKIYSVYEVKARLSEILRAVREGQTIAISYHGKPVAELRPYGGADRTLDRRLDRLADRGVLRRQRPAVSAKATGTKRPGALKRFLAERDE